MFDMGWSELLLVAVLAIVFVGPKDLPKLMRTLGQYAAKMRGMAREFQNSFEDLARETELDDLRKEVANLRDTAMKPLSNLDHAMNMDQAIKAAETPPGAVAADDAASPETVQPADAPSANPALADPTKGTPA
jgi:sec-independent protein translocase protein TatB